MTTEEYFRERAISNALKRARYEDRTALQVTHWFARAKKELEEQLAKAIERGITPARQRELIRQQEELLEAVASRYGQFTAERLQETYEETYYKSIFDMQQYAGVGSSFTMLDARGIYEATNTAWSGKHYSDRIWDNTAKLAKQLDRIINAGVLNGYGIERMSRDLRKTMDAGAYAARRVVRTEMAYVSGRAIADSYEEYGIERYKFLATLDLRTSEICRMMDGRVFDVAIAAPGINYPPMHPYCRSTTVGYFEDMVQGGRAARNEEGKTYEVPADMTYEEWHGKYVNGSGTSNNISGTINKAKANEIFTTEDSFAGGKITAYDIFEELTATEIGQNTIKYIEETGIRPKLVFSPQWHANRGEQQGDSVKIFLANIKNPRVAACTIIHEITHHKYGIGQSQWAEAVCMAKKKCT